MSFQVTINTVPPCPADCWTSRHSYSEETRGRIQFLTGAMGYIYKQNGMVTKEINLLSVTLALSAETNCGPLRTDSMLRPVLNYRCK